VNNYDNKIGIKAWAEEDRPREKLSSQGRRALTDAELIAILIGSGSRNETAVELSKRILHHYDNDLNKLGKASIAELSNFKGIGEAKAISIIYNIMKRHLVDLNHEEFWIVFTSRSSKLIGKELLSKGGLSATVVDPKIIFSMALQHQASNIFLVHNHPSGNLKPSHEDLILTKRLTEAGRLLDIRILDHLIVTDKGFYSMADEGLF
jgi:DNA repair protein RadC